MHSVHRLQYVLKAKLKNGDWLMPIKEIVNPLCHTEPKPIPKVVTVSEIGASTRAMHAKIAHRVSLD